MGGGGRRGASFGLLVLPRWDARWGALVGGPGRWWLANYERIAKPWFCCNGMGWVGDKGARPHDVGGWAGVGIGGTFGACWGGWRCGRVGCRRRSGVAGVAGEIEQRLRLGCFDGVGWGVGGQVVGRGGPPIVGMGSRQFGIVVLWACAVVIDNRVGWCGCAVLPDGSLDPGARGRGEEV